MKPAKLFYTAAAIIFFQTTAISQNISAKEIMEKSKAARESNDEKVEMEMTLISKQGNKNHRNLMWYSKMDKLKNRSTLIRFTEPADIKGSSFLSIDYIDKEDDQWLYLPALKKIRRVSSGNQTDSFLGTDFTFEDIGMDDDDLKDFDWSLLPPENVDGKECYVVQGIPNNDKIKKESGYNKRIYYISKDKFIQIKTALYDKKDEFSKCLNISDIKEVESGKLRGFNITMENYKTGHKTVLNFKYIKINQGITPETFTTRFLEKEI